MMEAMSLIREYWIYFAFAVFLFWIMQKTVHPPLDIMQTYQWGQLSAKKRGDKFEAWCADLLKANGFRSVRIMGGSGDQGADIVCRKHGRRYVIQCKCYDSPIGNKPVQEAHAAIKFFGNPYVEFDIAVVMTNTTFTSGGIEAARRCKVTLWDKYCLAAMCRHKRFTPAEKRQTKRRRTTTQRKPARTRKPTKRPVRRKRAARW